MVSKKIFLLGWCCWIWVSCWLGSVHGQDGFDKLVPQVPSGQNVYLIADFTPIRRSALALQGYWFTLDENQIVRGPLPFGANPKRVVVAAQMDFINMQRQHIVSILETEAKLDPETLRAGEDGQLEQRGQNHLILAPRDCVFVVPAESKILKIVQPNRQDWLQTVLSTTNSKPPLLLPLARQVATFEPVWLVLDLRGVLKPEEVEKWLKTTSLQPRLPMDRPAVSKWLSSLETATIRLRISREISAQITCQFKEPVGETEERLWKPIVLAALASKGFYLKEMERWLTQAQPNQLQLIGTLSEPNLANLLSFLEVPLPGVAEGTTSNNAVATTPAGPETATPLKPEELKLQAIASRRYLQQIQGLARNLRQEHNDVFSSTAGWYDRAADRIERLPRRQVDEQVFSYGTEVQGLWRELANALRQNVNQITLRPFNAPPGVEFNIPLGGRLANQIGVREENIEEKERIRDETWQKYEMATQKIEAAMTAKFGELFSGKASQKIPPQR